MGSASSKIRIDKLLVERGLAPSRERAEAMIMAGNVLVADVPVTKPGTKVDSDAEIRVRGAASPFVSRGGSKLDPALEQFGIDVHGLTAIDVGASTGGFTDCLLKRGVLRIYAVDVGYNQLDWKIRNDPRVVVMERLNAKDLGSVVLDPRPSLAVIDVSFIGLRKVLAPVCSVLATPSTIVALVKPQFELEPSYVGKGGVVRDVEHQQLAVELVKEYARSLGLKMRGEAPSSLKGEKKGNQEYFLWLSHEPDL